MKANLGSFIGIASLALILIGAGLHNETLIWIGGGFFGAMVVAITIASVLITHKQAG